MAVRWFGRIEYTDGREQDVSGGMPALRAWETYAARHGLPFDPSDAPKVTMSLVILHRLAGDSLGFEPWAETVENYELRSEEVNPTHEEPLADS